MGFANFKFLFLLVVVAVILAIEIAAAPSPWYQWKVVATNLKTNEYLSYIELPGGSTCKYTDDCIGLSDQFKTMYGIILTAVILSIILTAIETLVLFIWTFHFCHRLKFRSKLRVPLIIIAVLATVTAFVAWLVLFWHQSALKDGSHLDYDFSGDYSGPQAGWGLFLAASVLQFAVAVAIPFTGSPDHHGYKFFG